MFGRTNFCFFFAVAFFMLSVQDAAAQADMICGEQGGFVRRMSSSAVFGTVTFRGFNNTKKPRVTIRLIDSQSRHHRQFPDEAGNFCFRDINGSGGSISIEVDGSEQAKHNIPNIGPNAHRQDFEVAESGLGSSTPAVIEHYPRNEANTKLFEAAAAAEKKGDHEAVIRNLREIVNNDPKDHIVWTTLAMVYFNRDDMIGAESAYTSALVAKPDLTSAMIGLGKIYLGQKKHDLAVDVLLKAVKADPTSAPAYRLLGESLLLAKKGSLAVDALNEAIRLDPVGMAECHLLLARLYDLAGIKGYASTEYRLFLKKVPDHPDKKKFERYIKDNPEPKGDQ